MSCSFVDVDDDMAVSVVVVVMMVVEEVQVLYRSTSSNVAGVTFKAPSDVAMLVMAGMGTAAPWRRAAAKEAAPVVSTATTCGRWKLLLLGLVVVQVVVVLEAAMRPCRIPHSNPPPPTAQMICEE